MFGFDVGTLSRIIPGRAPGVATSGVVRSRVSVLGSSELGYCKHVARFLTGRGIHEKVLEKYFRITGTHSTILGLVVGLDVDCRCGRSLRVADFCGFAVSTADTVALGSGSADDELEVGG